MQKLSKLKNQALKKAPDSDSANGLWSKIASAVSNAFAGVTGRKQAERKRKRVAAAGAAGVATAVGAAGVVLSKKKSRHSEAERETAYQAPQPVSGSSATNGAAAVESVPSSSDPSA